MQRINKSFFKKNNVGVVLNPILVVIIFLLSLLLIGPFKVFGQQASPSNWMYPDGNLSATKFNNFRSITYQEVDSMKLK